jgi:hypothetical protein
MKSRFRKVWCSSCSSMQFAGECPHGRAVSAPVAVRACAQVAEKGLSARAKFRGIASLMGFCPPPGITP